MPTLPEPESLDQRRAARAWKDVDAVARAGELKEYRSLVRQFPSMVEGIDIGQAVAILTANASKKRAHRLLLDQLTSWLSETHAVPGLGGDDAREAPSPKDDAMRLFNALQANPSSVWWKAGEEAIAFSAWLKLLTEARYGQQMAKAAPKPPER